MRRSRPAVPVIAAFFLLVAFAVPAAADHTDPTAPLAPTDGVAADGRATGAGTWEHLQNFLPNPGSDLWFFDKDGATYASGGTLGQGDEGHVGQRIVQLKNADGELDVQWVADHGSANCPTANPAGTLGLQHDVEPVPLAEPELLVDATDATGRCHDSAGGGIEIIDVSGLGQEGFEVRELHLVRFAGTSHTLTVDQERPWIVYSNNSDASARNWLDFMDVRSCLTAASGGTMPDGLSLEDKRAHCSPDVYRIPFDAVWTQQTTTEDGEPAGASASCHDSTSVGTRLYCSGLKGEVILDVDGLVDGDGNLHPDSVPLACTTAAGTLTAAQVTNCSMHTTRGEAFAAGWELVGYYNHVGVTQGNTNHVVSADRGVAVSHQSAPTPKEIGDYLIVSDERGGGVVPPGASCAPGIDNPHGNGGLHFFDVSDPADIRHAPLSGTDGQQPAVWIGDVVIPAPAFCTVHVFHHVPDEQRLIMGYYSQGIKVLDYHVEEDGLRFEEVASYVLPGANTWVANFFDITDNPDGTRTYHLLTNDISRGMDVVSWTGPTNRIPSGDDEGRGGPDCDRHAERERGNQPRPCRADGERPGRGQGGPGGNAALLLMSLAVLPTAALAGRRRGRR